MIRYRRQVPNVGMAAAEAAEVVALDAPVPQPVDGVVKLQPLANRLAAAAAAAAAAAQAVSEPEQEDPVEEPPAPHNRLVTLVTPWPAEDDAGDEAEDEAGSESFEDGFTEEDGRALELALTEAGYGFRSREEEPLEAGTDGEAFHPPVHEAGLSTEPDGEPASGAARTPKVMVVDRSGRLFHDVERVASSLTPIPKVVRLGRPMELVEFAEAEDPDVVVVSPEEMTPTGLKRLAHVHKADPRVVILLSDNDKTWSASQIAATGASDFLPPNPSRPKLKSKLANALGTAAQLRVESIVVTERIVVHEAAPPQPDAGAAPQALARVFTVASPTGGSGKTTVATNLAAYLAKVPGRRVLLVDLDLQFGNLGPALHLHTQRSIGDLLEDAADLPEMVAEHAGGFKVLCAPIDPLQAEAIGPEEVSEILDSARKSFDFVVVDTPPVLNESCLAAFDRSEKVILLANLDVPSLKNMRRYLETIQTLGVSEEQPVLVLNRSDSNIGLELKGVTQLFRQGFLAVLPSAKDVPWSTNMGNPIVLANPKAEISRLLNEAFARLVPGPGEEAPAAKDRSARKSGLLGRKKGNS